MSRRYRRYEFLSREDIEQAIDDSKMSATCLGCDKPYKTDIYSHDYTEVPIGVWDVRVHDKLGCIDEARRRLSACPGCGDYGCAIGTICEKCGELIDKAREALPRLDELRAIEIKPSDLGPTLEKYWDDPTRREIANLIAKAVTSLAAPRMGKEETGDRTTLAYIMPEQHEAVTHLCNKIAEVMEQQRNIGRDEGHHLLVQLAQGAITPAKFEELETKARNGARVEAPAEEE